MLLTATANTFYAPVANNLTTTLTANISSGSTVIYVVSTTGFPSKGVISIGTEVIYYSGKTTGAFTGCIRGFDGTLSNNYDSGTIVELRWVAAHHNTLADEIVKIETVLGQSVSGDTTSVDARFQEYDNTESVTVVFPPNPRVGALHYASAIKQWYVYSTDGWAFLATTQSFIDLGNWAVQTASTNYMYPTTTDLVDVASAALFDSNSLSGYLGDLTGLGMLGRDDDRISYRTPEDTMVVLVENSRIVAPRVPVFQIDFPVQNKISGMVLIPSGSRNISDMYIAGVGYTGARCTITLNKISDGTFIDDYQTICTGSITIPYMDSPSVDVVGTTTVSLGTWNDGLYSIATGDVLFTKVESVTGTMHRVTATVEAPYWLAVTVSEFEIQDVMNTLGGSDDWQTVDYSIGGDDDIQNTL